MPGFVHLHNHSKYSILDGVTTPSMLVPHLQKLDMDTFAITDHGTMAGIPEFVKYINGDDNKTGFQPKIIAGCEFYEVDNIAHKSVSEAEDADSMSCEVEKRTKAQEREAAVDTYSKKNPRYWHITMLARNYEGYKKLIRLTAAAATAEAYYYKPRIDKSIMETIAKGDDILVGTGCAGSRLSMYAMEYDDYQGWSDRIDIYLKLFGEENVFAEIMANGFAGQKTINDKVIQWANRKGVAIVPTNDCHYVERDHARLQDIMLCVSTNQKVDDTQRKFKFEGDSYYVRSADEVIEAFAQLYSIDVTPYMDNTRRFADRCESAAYVEDKQFRLPTFDWRRADVVGFKQWAAARQDKLATRYPEEILREVAA